MADEVLNANDGTLNVRAGSLGGTSMRYHELAVQRWLNGLFFVREGYPVPVVFTSPMDAFSAFAQLWADDPFAYLLNLKDDKGTPLYEPYPSPVRYPVISVYRKGWKYRSYQNFSIHRWRHINWPTVANAGTERYGPAADGWDITKCRLGNVTTSRMPMAWDYRFQIDHFCNRPDTQAFFVEQLMQEFWRTGGVPQTWITVPYPGWGNRRVRLYLEGEIESLTPEEPEEGKNVEYRTSFTVIVEGFDVDLRYEVYPALWEIIFRFGPVAPITLERAFYGTHVTDVRIDGSNSSINLRPNVPSWGTCQEALEREETWLSEQTFIQMVSLNETTNNQFGVFTIGTEAPQVLVYGTDRAGVGGTFVYGGLELFVNVQNGAANVGFVNGTLMDVILSTDTLVQNGTSSVSFVDGTLAEAIVYDYGTDYGTTALTLLEGTLFDCTAHAGTWYEGGAVSTTFVDGTLATLILSAGTWFEETGVVVGFLDGTLA